MKSGNFTSLIRELMAIFFMSLVLALMYNAFSQKGLSLIRTTPQKVVVNDSALFSQPSKVDTLKKDTVKVSQAKGATSSDQHSPAKSDSASGEVRNDEISYKILTLAQVKRLIDERRVLLVDARDAEAYKKAHIKGAINIFGDEPEQHFEELTKVSPDTLIVTYCNGPDCHLGRSLIKFLTMMEFKHLYLYEDGWDGWEKANMPVEKSPEQ